MAMDLGDRLRSARERKGLTLSEIAARTKISVHALEAIEAEQFDRLPRGVFRRAYLRAFAGVVGLDADACVRAYADFWEPPPPPEPEPRLSSWTDNRLRALLAVLVAIGSLAAIPLLSALWRATAAVGAPARAERLERATAQKPAPAAVTPVSSVRLPRLRIEIRATDACWISATADNASAVRRLVRAGETVRIDATSAIVMHLGDAGAVAFTINGAPARVVGQRGEPVTIQITRGAGSGQTPELRRLASKTG